MAQNKTNGKYEDNRCTVSTMLSFESCPSRFRMWKTQTKIAKNNLREKILCLSTETTTKMQITNSSINHQFVHPRSQIIDTNIKQRSGQFNTFPGCLAAHTSWTPCCSGLDYLLATASLRDIKPPPPPTETMTQLNVGFAIAAPKSLR